MLAPSGSLVGDLESLYACIYLFSLHIYHPCITSLGSAF